VVDRFIALPAGVLRDTGMIAMSVRGPNGQRTLAWASRNARTLFFGNAIGADGRDLSLNLLGASDAPPTQRAKTRGTRETGKAAVVSHPAVAPSARGGDSTPKASRGPGWLYDRLEEIGGIALATTKGAPKGTVYVLADPNCPFCARFYHRLSPAVGKIAKAGVKIVWVPVAFLKGSSIARAERILAGGIRALRKNETGFKASEERGGLPAKPILDQKPRVARATQAFFDSGILVATPTLVWRDRRGTAHFISGVPDNHQFNAMMDSMGAILP
jgi:hypothetical protein